MHHRSLLVQGSGRLERVTAEFVARDMELASAGRRNVLKRHDFDR